MPNYKSLCDVTAQSDTYVAILPRIRVAEIVMNHAETLYSLGEKVWASLTPFLYLADLSMRRLDLEPGTNLKNTNEM